MSEKQRFERLLKLEDEELNSIVDNEVISDACHIAMLSDGELKSIDKSANLDMKPNNARYKQSSANMTGISFNMNGRHIHMSPEQLKYLSLITLTIQNAALNLTMRAARTQKDEFSTPIAVTIAEVLKLITCIGLVWYDQVKFQDTVKTIKTYVVDNYIDTLKVAVPSFVYYVQNNLLYVGSGHLDAATCQVTYQLKILTTAIFSVVMLNKKLSRTQWLALIMLFIGVAFIETVAVADHTSKSHTVIVRKNDTSNQERHEKPIIGFVAILIACCLSGFAGVYFEKILKDSIHVSLWIRNIQLSAATIPIGLLQILITEYEHVTTKGIFFGFTSLTYFCILLQVQGGLLVAVVVKFANNILKGFATSMAIVISTVASIFLFSFDLTPVFVFGASMVVCSVMMYNKQ